MIEDWLNVESIKQKSGKLDVWVLGSNGFNSFLIVKMQSGEFIFSAAGSALVNVISVEQIKKLCQLLGVRLNDS